MSADIFYGVSLGLLAGGSIATVVLHKLPFKKNPVFSVLNCLMITVFLSSFALLYPIQEMEYGAGGFNTVESLVFTIFSTIGIFVKECDYGVLKDFGQNLSPHLQGSYNVFCLLLYTCAPLLTVGFALSFFKNIRAYWKLFWSFHRDIYVFSALNQNSLMLATDIKQKTPHAQIVFTKVGDAEEEAISEWEDETQQLKAICFKKAMVDVRWDLSRAGRKVYLFAIGEKEEENLEQAVALENRYRGNENFCLYVFSVSAESEMLFSTVSGGIHVRRVNPIRIMTDHFLYEEGGKIFESALNDGTAQRQISVVLLGLGQHGTELLKAMPWFCQMDGYSVQIHAFDRDLDAAEKFSALCPELMSPQRNGTMEEGEAQYHIHIYPGVDVQTAQFREKIRQLEQITCVFAALGDDSNNVEAAVTMRMLCERKGIHPLIHAIVYSGSKREMLEQVTDYRGHSYDIRFIGDVSFTYTNAHIADSELYREALQRHLKWGAEQDFWAYEFNFRSSVAAAIHLKMREECGMPWCGKAEDALTLEERDALERLEHRRWNAYMRSDGYVYSGSIEKSSRNDLGKLHNNLVPYDELPDKIKRLDSAVGSK